MLQIIVNGGDQPLVKARSKFQPCIWILDNCCLWIQLGSISFSPVCSASLEIVLVSFHEMKNFGGNDVSRAMLQISLQNKLEYLSITIMSCGFSLLLVFLLILCACVLKKHVSRGD